MFIKQATFSVNPTNSHIYISDKNITAKKIEMMWNKVPGAEAYNVYRYNNTSNNYILVKTTDDTKFAESELEPNTQYKYIVASVKNGKKDITSNPITIKTEIFETVPVSKNEYSLLVVSDTEKRMLTMGTEVIIL